MSTLFSDVLSKIVGWAMNKLKARLVITLSFLEGVLANLKRGGVPINRTTVAAVLAVPRALGLPVTAFEEATLTALEAQASAIQALEAVPKVEAAIKRTVEQLQAQIDLARRDGAYKVNSLRLHAAADEARAEGLRGLLAMDPDKPPEPVPAA